jgi:hypothetical protein
MAWWPGARVCQRKSPLTPTRALQTVDGSTVVQTAGAEIHRIEMNLFERILSFLADPNIAFLLISLDRDRLERRAGELEVVYVRAGRFDAERDALSLGEEAPFRPF